MLADMYGHAYALDYPNQEGAMEKLISLSEKALRLEPDSQIVRLIYVTKCFLTNQKAQFFLEVDHCLKMKLFSPMRLGTLGFQLSLYGDWERGIGLLAKAMNKNIGYPLFFHGATSLFHFRKKNFQLALEEAERYDMPGLFWGPMLRVACLGQLGQPSEAVIQMDHIKKLKPDFEEKAYFLISRFVKQDELVEMIIDGLLKAGMHLHSTK